MDVQDLPPQRASVDAIVAALAGVPAGAYSVPHVYPSAAPDFSDAPLAERPPLEGSELRLYLHVPFCRYHCTFCHYAVRVGATNAVMSRYVAALERELDWIPAGASLTQLFVGGGTPTALPPELLDRLLESVFRRTKRVEGTVHVVEASPETITPAHIEVLRRHGIGRVSMGIQSLQEPVLDAVRREQPVSQALEVVDLLVDSGLILNADLIYGLPEQREDDFIADLHTLAERGVPSLTLYGLRTNERTAVTKALRDSDRLDVRRLMRWRALIEQTTASLGYTQVRWHTFKRLDTPARLHTRLPCFDAPRGGFQFGAGMSARSHLGHTIYRNHFQMNEYMDRIEAGSSPVQQVFVLGEEDRRTQFIGRSLGDGGTLDRHAYAAAFGSPVEEHYGGVLESLRAGGLIDDDGDVVSMTPAGRLLYDLVTLAFYPHRARQWLGARSGWIGDQSAEGTA